MTDEKPDKIKRIPGHEWAKKQARERGYTGGWPPKPVGTAKSPEGVISQVTAISAGDARTSMITAAGRGLERFIETMTPDDCKGFAETIKRVIHDPKNSSKTQMVAVRALIKPILRMLKMATDSRKLPDTRITRVIVENLRGFMEAITEDDMAAASRKLIEISQTKKYDILAIRAASEAMLILQEVYELYRTAYDQLVRANAQPRAKDTPEFLEAKRQIELIEAELEGEAEVVK